jgi:hypothetical protein
MANPRGRIVDGPAAGREARVYFLGQWSPSLCWRDGTGPWQHHVHEGCGEYRHVGPCVDHHDPGDMPGNRDSGCPDAVDRPVDRERIRS